MSTITKAITAAKNVIKEERAKNKGKFVLAITNKSMGLDDRRFFENLEDAAEWMLQNFNSSTTYQCHHVTPPPDVSDDLVRAVEKKQKTHEKAKAKLAKEQEKLLAAERSMATLLDLVK